MPLQHNVPPGASVVHIPALVPETIVQVLPAWPVRDSTYHTVHGPHEGAEFLPSAAVPSRYSCTLQRAAQHMYTTIGRSARFLLGVLGLGGRKLGWFCCCWACKQAFAPANRLAKPPLSVAMWAGGTEKSRGYWSWDRGGPCREGTDTGVGDENLPPGGQQWSQSSLFTHRLMLRY
jgi:hypothetical protein